jgi:hypothetical protein
MADGNNLLIAESEFSHVLNWRSAQVSLDAGANFNQRGAGPSIELWRVRRAMFNPHKEDASFYSDA